MAARYNVPYIAVLLSITWLPYAGNDQSIVSDVCPMG